MSKRNTLEYGARYQFPVYYNDLALSFHKRYLIEENSTEYRFGLDYRYDAFVGLWFEGNYSHFDNDIKSYISMTLGFDYTFNIGSGLYLLAENNVYKSIDFLNYSAIMFDYPVNLLDSVSNLIVYDYDNKKCINTLMFKRQYDYLSFELSLSYDFKTNPDLGKAQFLWFRMQYDF